MKANKNTSFFKILASLVGAAGVSALMSFPAFALTNLTRYTTGTVHSQAVPPTDDTTPEKQPGEGDKPGQPDQPVQPGQPGQPDQPVQPGQPDETMPGQN